MLIRDWDPIAPSSTDGTDESIGQPLRGRSDVFLIYIFYYLFSYFFPPPISPQNQFALCPAAAQTHRHTCTRLLSTAGRASNDAQQCSQLTVHPPFPYISERTLFDLEKTPTTHSAHCGRQLNHQLSNRDRQTDGYCCWNNMVVTFRVRRL